MDPIDLDRLLPAVWQANAAGDVRALLSLIREIAPPVADVERMSISETLATMRDLGILLGSVKRNGAEPVSEISTLEEVLRLLAQRSGLIPRDTIHHYIRWNPTGRRERMYTGLPMERLLMAAVRISLPRLSDAVDLCVVLDSADAGDLTFALAANELAALVGAMEHSIDTVLAGVTPEFFARTMRPFFEEIRVGDEVYLGPAAAHVPLSVVDLLVWACDHGGDEYLEFADDSVVYGLEHWKPLHGKWRRTTSLVTRVTEELKRCLPDETLSLGLYASAEALCRTMRSLMVFRGKHLTIARKAYAADIGLYELGSGGGSVAMLEAITDATRATSTLLRRSVTTHLKDLG
ncbi:monodechloroaminopyrrolnitrin synthase PrnB family protein [Amycolatopsis sp. EV170708-02-1]|uniref:monodechloroaminopyrrolnitrin synthase PrnB family protein n=1 Tax=Amycolatopsis sp. EV170708-02-1 TaxID=2919322 RepID=UPI001F0C66AE|nr:monodechloroaminopyrrolnitrin synthase PrnB family protein [Amycolatopsis sp. EV170708-02-1]UMP06738.1 DUF1864 family protein [Amycolatopsis sp. EV170708-02-1]